MFSLFVADNQDRQIGVGGEAENDCAHIPITALRPILAQIIALFSARNNRAIMPAPNLRQISVRRLECFQAALQVLTLGSSCFPQLFIQGKLHLMQRPMRFVKLNANCLGVFHDSNSAIPCSGIAPGIANYF